MLKSGRMKRQRFLPSRSAISIEEIAQTAIERESISEARGRPAAIGGGAVALRERAADRDGAQDAHEAELRAAQRPGPREGGPRHPPRGGLFSSLPPSKT